MTRFRTLVLLSAVPIAVLAAQSCTTGDGDGTLSPTGSMEPTPTPTPVPQLTVRSCDVTVSIDTQVGSVGIAGSFNAWAPQPMQRDGDRWTVNLGPLSPGTYPYKFLFNDQWEDDVPDDVYTAYDGGIENRALRVGDCNRPSLSAVSGTADAKGNLSAVFQLTSAADGALIDPASVVATVHAPAGPVDVTVNPDNGRITVRTAGLAPGKHSVRVSAQDSAGRAAEEGAVFLPLWVEPEPYAWSDGLLYFLFTDRFRWGGDSGQAPVPGAWNGADYKGGDFIGAKQALDEGWFDALGVRSIWISPVYENPDWAYVARDGQAMFSGYHGYWPTEPRGVESRFGIPGTPADQALKDFIDSAHAKGIRVLFDMVLNHVHQDHPWVSDHPEWFSGGCVCQDDPGDPCSWDNNPIFCQFVPYLPDLNYRITPLLDLMLADLRWWIEEFDVDGFRVDAAKHMDHVIMRSASLMVRDLYETPGGPRFYMVGETFTGRGGQGDITPYLAEHELDGQFDFPLFYAVRESIGDAWGFDGLAWELGLSEQSYGSHLEHMSTFMGNHDIPRYATRIGGCSNPQFYDGCEDHMDLGDAFIDPTQWDIINKMSMSFAFTATLPGVPLLYYGDEVGLAGNGDPDNRRFMHWDTPNAAQSELLSRIRAIGQARASHRALQRGVRTTLWQDNEIFIYSRTTPEGDGAIVAMNIGSGARNENIPIPSTLNLEGRVLTDALGTGRAVTVQGYNVSISLNPWEYVIFVAE